MRYSELEDIKRKIQTAELFTPKEIIEKYELITKINYWDTRRISQIAQAGLLLGRLDYLEKKFLIREDTFIMTARYADFLKEYSKVNPDYEIIQRVLDCLKIN